MQANKAELNLEFDDANTSERAGEPELVVVESTRVHADAVVRSTDNLFCQVKKMKQVGATRLLLGRKNDSASRQFDTLLLQILNSKHAR